MQMMMRQLVMSAEALGVLSRTGLKAKTAFKVAEFMATAETKLASFRKAREAMVAEHGGTVQGMAVDFADVETRKKFEAELNELLDTEVEMPDLKLAQKDVADVTLEPRFLVTLGWAFGISPLEEEEES